jgi:hypothetical protein
MARLRVTLGGPAEPRRSAVGGAFFFGDLEFFDDMCPRAHAAGLPHSDRSYDKKPPPKINMSEESSHIFTQNRKVRQLNSAILKVPDGIETY